MCIYIYIYIYISTHTRQESLQRHGGLLLQRCNRLTIYLYDIYIRCIV